MVALLLLLLLLPAAATTATSRVAGGWGRGLGGGGGSEGSGLGGLGLRKARGSLLLLALRSRALHGVLSRLLGVQALDVLLGSLGPFGVTGLTVLIRKVNAALVSKPVLLVVLEGAATLVQSRGVAMTQYCFSCVNC